MQFPGHYCEIIYDQAKFPHAAISAGEIPVAILQDVYVFVYVFGLTSSSAGHLIFIFTFIFTFVLGAR